MNIDKSKLQPLLWAVVGAWRAGGQELQERTDALDGFLGEHAVEEVALQLLAELNLACEANDAYAADKKRLAFALNDARAEAAALRKDAERYRWLRDEEYLHAWADVHVCDELRRAELTDKAVDAAMAKEVSHG
ncbi:hypothetical protein LOY54_14275 [Pseudomonas sp. B21-032]|uniref:hypothetical protein n=1 Tax=Pseudomonas sp. B21-032 TaxID=2895483 RepID=UPI0021603804|nr:hypothetical protein [Pseudomonas sp. B21-032]UVL59226.1 hypothetical protein LOY54_14275 [Pseudomonas sp. B21-032]